jgi:large subunit ribosomal protein L3
MKFLIGKKLGMTQTFDEKGNVVPVTLIEGGPCVVTQVKTTEKDGYVAFQIGYGTRKKNSKPLVGHLQKAGQEAITLNVLREFRVREGDLSLKQGESILVDIFESGEKVSVAGIAKGKGFAGVVKRWGFAGLPSSHGTKHEQRKGGSIGSRYPQRVVKGKKMPGRLGGQRVTVKNITVASVNPQENLLALLGQVPGVKGSFIEITKK